MANCFKNLQLALIRFVIYRVYRKGSRLGHDTVVDGMLKDGLWDVYNDFGMGVCGEICADKYRISREEQVFISICYMLVHRDILAFYLKSYKWS